MTRPAVGTPAPDFQLPATGGQTLSLADFRGRNVVLYFYPKDNTPGCTTESQEFRDRAGDFEQANTVVIGISRDSVRSHENFRSKHELGCDLLADTNEVACNAFDVLREKNMYGRKVRGIERSTFLIDANGVLQQEWRGVKVPGHVDEVLAAARNLSGDA
ncbi:peroxiredoxin [Halofilum ochraceum]|uniref:peroxiredoxin n=1 Tax=Halofilum ochraceum TaxID=1611323 RepID=UPI00082C72F6|nr:peroxiredoxin [Halofilum ochraceum]